jgi:hypothetical protein
MEHLAEQGLLGDQGQGDQGAGQRPQVQGGAAVALADRDRPGGLEGEVLGGEGLHERRLAVVVAELAQRLGCRLVHGLLLTDRAHIGHASRRATGDLGEAMERAWRRTG